MINRAIPLLHVSNIAAAVEFYCSGLGFRLEYAHSPNDAEEDPCYLHLSRDGAWINLSSYSGDGVAGGVVNFMVDDVDTLHEEFLAKHVVIDTPPSPPWINRGAASGRCTSKTPTATACASSSERSAATIHACRHQN